MRILRRILIIIAAMLVLALIGGIFYTVTTVRASFPQVTGEIPMAGVQAPVKIVRDQLGIPQIYANSIDDLFFAQGYAHAQDRFWEMDVRRHITAGRLSEMFGATQVPTDSFLRTLGWRRVAEQELPLLSPRSRQILTAYTKGVNAYLTDHQGSALSLEYAVLGLQNSSYVPEPWNPVDSIAWLKALAWDLRGNMADEVYRSVMSESVGVDQTEKLFPDYPYLEHRPIVEGGAVVDGVFNQNALVNSGAHPMATGVSFVGDAHAKAALLGAKAGGDLLQPWLGASGAGIGSNSWVVSGAKTNTGAPLLANDPHLAPAMPSLWYQVGLHCTTRSSQCDYDVAGWTMAGLPGVFIGHNDTIAWGFTNLGPDVTDMVLEKVDGDTYQLDGTAVAMTTRQETIKVAGEDPVVITVRETVDGPLISDVAGIDTYGAVGADAPVPAPGSISTKEVPPARGSGYAVALRWTALTPQPTFDAFNALNTARNWNDFRAAARLLSVPAQNLIYADTSGNIGYQTPGRIPIRSGYDGKWPIPGWSSRYHWQGYIPFDALPSVTNPPEGWIVTANQAAVGPEYPYFLTDDWSYGARSQRIVDLIEAATVDGATISADQMRTMQMDTHNELATYLVPRLAGIEVPAEATAAMALLTGWDDMQGPDSAAAAYFNALWAQMVGRMFDAATDSSEISASGSDQFWQVIKNIWDTPDDFWWDDKTTPGIQTRDQTIAASMSAASAQLTAQLGPEPTSWRWGALHTLEFTNATLGDSGIGPIEAIFNRGPIETGGGESTVDATSWTPQGGFTVDWVPSMRQVIDLSAFDSSTWVNLTGSSGHAYNSNYTDQITAWQTGQQYPWAFSPRAVDAAAAAVLTLVPPS